MPPDPDAVAASVDTIELFSSFVPKGLRREVQAAQGQRIVIKDCRDATGHLFGHRVIVNRPALAVLPALASYRRHHRWMSTHRVDIAVDLAMPNEQSTESMADWLDRHLVLKWRSSQTRKVRFGNAPGHTVYWCDNRRSRNLALYHKRGNVLRLEFRFQNSAAVRRAKLDDLEKLRTLNPAELFAHHLKAAVFRPEYVVKAVRRFRDPDRVRHVLDNVDLADFLSGQAHPERIAETVTLAIPNELIWP